MATFTQLTSRIKKAYQIVAGTTLPAEELSSYDSPYYSLSQVKPYNPDELVNRKGGFDVYRLMLIDDMVKSALHIKKLSVMASGYKIEPGSENEIDVKIAKKIEYDLTDGMDGNFNICLRDILSAMEYGFSVTEIIPQIYKNGEYKGLMGLKKLKTRPPHGFEFHTDGFNNLTKLRQNITTGFKDFSDNMLKYFIIYSYNSDFGNWYGSSDLRAAYRPYWSKDITIRFLNIYNERFGMGILVGRYPRGMGPEEQNDLLAIIKNIQAKTAFKLPKDVEIELLESAKRGASAYIETIDKYDMMISRAVLLPNLAGYGKTEGGSYALGKEQMDLYFTILDAIRNELEEILNEQLMPQLVDWNYLNVTRYPKFKFKPLTQKDKNALATLFITAWEKGAVVATTEDEDYLRSILEFPKRKTESVPLERPKVASPGIVNNMNSSEETRQIEKTLTKIFSKLSRRPNKYENKVDFTKMAKQLDGLEYEYGLELGKLITRIKDDLTSSIIRKKLIEDRNPDTIEKLDLKYIGDMRLFWKDALRKTFTAGRKDARNELPKKYAAAPPAFGNLPPKEALAYLERKAFYLAGAEKDFILKNVKAILYDAMKTGAAQADVMYNLENFFEAYKVEQMLPSGEMAAVDEIPGRIETIIRTNFNDAYNQGRLAMFQDEDVKDFIVAYQYSAIMDDRTTELCAALDGLIYKTNNPIWNKITPPNHFGERSILIPVLSDEGWDGVEDDLPDLSLLQVGFGG